MVVYLRRQDRLATSFYSTFIRGGGCSESVIPPALPHHYFDHAALIERWSAGFAGRLMVAFYDRLARPGGIVEDFASRIGLPPLAGSHEIFNCALSEATQEVIRRLNVHLANSQGTLDPQLIDLVIRTDAARGARPGRTPSLSAARIYHAAGATSSAIEAIDRALAIAPDDSTYLALRRTLTQPPRPSDLASTNPAEADQR